MMHAGKNLTKKTSFLIANIALLSFFLVDIPGRLYPTFHRDLIDGMRGFFLAISVGFLILTTIRNKR